MTQGNLPLNENERRALTNSQLLQLAREHGIVLTDAEQRRFTNSQLVELPQSGQTLTQASRNQLTNEQRIHLHSIAQEPASQMHETNQKPILISHASDDKALVEKFVDLLVDGIGVRRDDIFCTSLEQMGVPPGENFVSFIKSQIQSPQLVLMVITPTYLRRTFCLCEMGACWALSLKGIPLIAEPVSFSDLGGVVSEVQVTKLSDKSRMTELRDSVVQEMNLEGKFSTVWERKRDEFIDWLDSNPAVSPKSTSIAEVASAPMEMTDSPSMKLAGRIGKVIQLIERRLGNGDAQISSDATRRLFKDVHELLTNIYAEAPDGLRSATFRECVTLVEDVYAPHPFEKAYKTVERVTKAVDRLREFHEYLMVGI